MINQINQNENTQNQFSNAISELQIGKLLRKSNITKFHLSTDITDCIKSKVTDWMNSQATFIQALLEISAGKVELYAIFLGAIIYAIFYNDKAYILVIILNLFIVI